MEESDDLVQALANLVTEACLIMSDDEKKGMILCRDHWSSGYFSNKKAGLRFLRDFCTKKYVTYSEYKKVRKEIRNSKLPWNDC